MVEDELICICINAGWMAAFSRNSDRLSFEFLSQSFDPTLMPIGLEIQFFGLEKSERPQKARSLCKANIFLRSCQIPSAAASLRPPWGGLNAHLEYEYFDRSLPKLKYA